MSDSLAAFKASQVYEVAKAAVGDSEADAIAQEVADAWDNASAEQRHNLFSEGQHAIAFGKPSETLNANFRSERLGGIGLFLVGAGLVAMGISLM